MAIQTPAVISTVTTDAYRDLELRIRHPWTHRWSRLSEWFSLKILIGSLLIRLLLSFAGLE